MKSMLVSSLLPRLNSSCVEPFTGELSGFITRRGRVLLAVYIASSLGIALKQGSAAAEPNPNSKIATTTVFSNRVNTAIVPTPGGGDTWKTRHEAINARAKHGNVDLIYIGDSIVRSWMWDGTPVWDHYLRPDGSIPAFLMPDFEHPNEEGHRVWAAAFEPKVAELMGDTPTPAMPTKPAAPSQSRP
jgi:hypothetical protein